MKPLKIFFCRAFLCLILCFVLTVDSSFGQSASFSATGTMICGPAGATSTTFQGTASCTITWCSWYFPGASPDTSTAAAPTVSYTAPGTYTVTMVAYTICGTDSVTQTVQIASSGLPSVTITASSDTICYGDSNTLTASGATAYLWSTGATTSSITVSPTVTTSYSVTGFNALGCAGTDSITIIVKHCAKGSTWRNPLPLNDGTCHKDLTIDSSLWFSFIAHAPFVQVIFTDANPFTPVSRLVLYTDPPSNIDSIGGATFSLIPFVDSNTIILSTPNLIVGQKYYVKAVASAIHAGTFSACIFNKLPPPVNCRAGCNAIGNGDFEGYTLCPPGWQDIGAYPNPYTVNCWYDLDCTLTSPFTAVPSSDYFNSCFTAANGVGVPNNGMGNANNNPTTGTPAGTSTTGGYAGLLAHWNTYHCGDCGAPDNFREYILQPFLTAPTLAKGATYNVSFWVQRAVSGNYKVNGDDIGIYFSTCAPGIYVTGNYCAVDCNRNPIPFPASNIITASSGNCNPPLNTPGEWSNITGTYTANGTENYVTIGNFNPVDNADDETYVPGSPNISNKTFDYAYYYIDNVSVELAALPPITASPANICIGGHSTLTISSIAGYSLTWAPAASLNTNIGPTVIASPTVTTTYTVTATGPTGCQISETVTVYVGAPCKPTLTVRALKYFCPSTPIFLFASSCYATSYEWALFEPHSGDFSLTYIGVVPYNYNDLSANVYNTAVTVAVRGINACGAGPWTYYHTSSAPQIDCRAQTERNMDTITIDGDSSQIADIACNLYPNPAGSVLYAEIPSIKQETVYLSIYNALGQEVEHRDLKTNLTAIPVSQLPSGLYYYRITDVNGTIIKADKQIIQH